MIVIQGYHLSLSPLPSSHPALIPFIDLRAKPDAIPYAILHQWSNLTTVILTPSPEHWDIARDALNALIHLATTNLYHPYLSLSGTLDPALLNINTLGPSSVSKHPCSLKHLRLASDISMGAPLLHNIHSLESLTIDDPLLAFFQVFLRWLKGLTEGEGRLRELHLKVCTVTQLSSLFHTSSISRFQKEVSSSVRYSL